MNLKGRKRKRRLGQTDTYIHNLYFSIVTSLIMGSLDKTGYGFDPASLFSQRVMRWEPGASELDLGLKSLNKFAALELTET